jgi:DNA polymerase elongation subunit (family B)
MKISKVGPNKKLEWLNISLPQNQLYEWSLVPAKPGQIPDPTYTCWHENKPVYKHDSWRLNDYRIQEVLSNLDDETKEKIFEFNSPSILFCDIETEVIDGFPDYKNPKEQVTVVGFFDSDEQVARVLGIKELPGKQIEEIEDDLNEYFKDFFPEGIRFEYQYFSNEFDMMSHIFGTIFREAMVVTGWNFINFDWNYLTARAERLGINPAICSEDGKLTFRENVPKHKLVIDYLDIFKKWGNMHKELENFTLDHVAETITKKKKVPHSESLQDMFEANFKKYVYYNIVDVILVYLIDKKKKTFLTMCKLAQLGSIETRNAKSPVRFTEAVLCRKFYEKNQVLVKGYNPFEHENNKLIDKFGDKIKGGYVKEPDKDLFKVLAGSDFASLYPTIMRMFGLSPDVYLGLTDELPNEVTEKSFNSVWNTSFSREPSIVKELLDNYYSERKRIQGEGKKLLEPIKKIKDELAKRGLAV